TYFTTSNGELHVYASSGQPLVDSRAHQLAYTAAGNVSATMAFPGNFDEITLDGNPVTSSLGGGEIGALLELRDETLPAFQDELDALAAALIEKINAVTNQGTAVPAPQSLTGTASYDPTDAFSGSGTLRIALVDSDGIVDTIVDLDLSAYATNQDLVDAIDAIAGIDAAFDAEGHLRIEATDPDLGIALNEMDSAVGTEGAGASAYFGLNDLFEGTSASTIKVTTDLATDSTRLTTATLSANVGLSAGDVGLGSGDSSIADVLEALMGGDVDFAAAGSLSATSTTFADYAGAIVSDVANQASLAESDAETARLTSENLETSLINRSGVNLDEETAILTALENQYSACSRAFSVINEMFEALLDAVSR
ncbi:MAG: flagellar hook-associated protein FlgK, partial [Rhodospirillales bacterium]|nr:flagellar hook-associated protein FlgK [Rhodospirillales bacterium]